MIVTTLPNENSAARRVTGRTQLAFAMTGAMATIGAPPQTASKKEPTAPDLSVYVMRDQQTFGPFTHGECLQMIESGQLQPTDWAYLEGDDECEPLGELLAGIVACD